MTLTARPSQIHDSRQEPGLPIPCQVRRPVPCRPVLDFHRFSGPIHAGGPPYVSVALQQFTKNRKVRNPTSRRPYTAAHASQILMRLGSPYGSCSNTFPWISHTAHKLQKIRLQIQRDQRLVHVDPRIQRVCSNSTVQRRGASRRRRQGGGLPGVCELA